LEDSEASLRASKASVIALQQELQVAKIEFEGEKRMMEVRMKSTNDSSAAGSSGKQRV
jgi:hypothetical protein